MLLKQNQTKMLSTLSEQRWMQLRGVIAVLLLRMSPLQDIDFQIIECIPLSILSFDPLNLSTSFEKVDHVPVLFAL